MGGDKIPGPFDYLVIEFEKWKTSLPKVKIDKYQKYRIYMQSMK